MNTITVWQESHLECGQLENHDTIRVVSRWMSSEHKEMVEPDSGSCLMAGFGNSDVRPSGPITVFSLQTRAAQGRVAYLYPMKCCVTSSPDATADMQMKQLELQNDSIKQTRWLPIVAWIISDVEP